MRDAGDDADHTLFRSQGQVRQCGACVLRSDAEENHFGLLDGGLVALGDADRWVTSG